jgi:hypothetical protein
MFVFVGCQRMVSSKKRSQRGTAKRRTSKVSPPGAKKKAATSGGGTARRVRIDVKPYGDPIRKAIARGDFATMKKLAASSVAWLQEAEKDVEDVRIALAKLQAAINSMA